jgi:[ribosomal protein S5]-alanine N-acetyltransferase
MEDQRKFVIPGEKVKIRDKKMEDAPNDYAWSRDPELSRLDAATPLNINMSAFMQEYSAELRYPSLTRRRFAIDTLDGIHIGNCSYYNIDLKRSETEIGIMIANRDYWDKGYGTDCIKALVKYIFQNTTFKRLYLKTLDWNFRAQACFKKCGFLPQNKINREGFAFIIMELDRKSWEKQNTQQETHEPTTLTTG